MAQDASKDGLGVRGVTRRIFVGGIASACVPRREYLTLEAIAAERMPHRMMVSGVARSPFFELRDYGTASPELDAILRARGRAVRLENGKFLFPFESLAAREQVWRGMSVDPDWIGLLPHVALNEIAVFRTL